MGLQKSVLAELTLSHLDIDEQLTFFDDMLTFFQCVQIVLPEKCDDILK